MNKINTFTDRAARDVVNVVRKVKRTIPPMFGSRKKVIGESARANSYVYEITGSFTAGSPATAKATIYARDEVTVVETDADWVGNLHMFDDHSVGSKGICKKVGSVYVAENSPCASVAGGGGLTTQPSTVVVSATPPTNTSVLWIDTSGLP